MITVSQERIRFALDLTKWFNAPTDVITSQAARISNAATLRIELALSYGLLLSDDQLIDLTNWDSITVELKNLEDVDGVPIWSKTVANADFNTALAFADWEAGTDQHVTLEIDAETNTLSMSSQQKNFWLVISALTTDATAKTIPIAGFQIQAIENGITQYVPPSVTTPTYYTAAQSDARYLLAADLTAKLNKAGGTMTGALILAAGQMSGATGLYATTKTYVDAGDSAVASASVPNTGNTTIAGVKTFSSLITASGGITTAGTVTLGSLAGVLKGTSGVVSGGATTTDLTEGTQLYFTNVRADARITAQKGAASGICPLDSGSLIDPVYLPAIGATTFTAASQSAMLALSGVVKGDVVLRSDNSTVYILKATPASTLSNWAQWLYPVTSVVGRTGVIVLATGDIASESGGNLWFTNARAIGAPLTSFVATSGGTVTSSDSVLAALQRLEYRTNVNDGKVSGSTCVPLAGGTMSGELHFSGTNHQGLVVVSLNTTQRNALTGANGAMIYNTTDNRFNMYQNGSWLAVSSAPTWFNDTDTTFSSGAGVNGDYFVVGATGAIYVKRSGSYALQAGPFVKLAGGTGSTMTGKLVFQDGLTPALDFTGGTGGWTQQTGNSDAEFWLQSSGTPYWKFKNDGGLLITSSGYYDTGSSGVYKLNGTTVISGGAVPVFTLAGGWTVTTDNTSNVDLFLNGGSGKVHTSNDFQAANITASGGNIETGGVYKVSGTQVLGAQQPAIADVSPTYGWASFGDVEVQFAALVASYNVLLGYLRNHGILDT